MDNFERNIRDNASQFDDYKADRAKLWAHIAKELEPPAPKVVPLWRRPLLRVAAGLALMIGLASLMGGFLLKTSGDTTQYASKELLEIDRHYKGLVSYQVKLVQNHPRLSPMDKEEFLSFMDELDVEYEALRIEIENNLDNERILEAIVANYKKRIELIENLLQQINDAKNTDEEFGYTL